VTKSPEKARLEPKKTPIRHTESWGRPGLIALHHALQILPAADLGYKVNKVLMTLIRKPFKFDEVTLEPLYVSTSL